MDRSDDDGAMPPMQPLSTLRDLGTRDAVCPSHGGYVATGRKLGSREVWTTCPACNSEREAAEQAERDREAAAALARRREAAIGLACIPQRFRGLSFDSYAAETPQQRRAVMRMRDFAKRFDEHRKRGTGVVLAGKPGTGKTHLVAAVLLELVGGQAWVQYMTCMGLIRMVRDTWRRDSERSEKDVIRMLGEQIDLLVIDEVGVQYGTDSEQNILFEILDRRYAELKPTLLVTNQDKEGFKSFIGERVADRLSQTHEWLVFDWPSYRKQARAA